MTFLRELDDLTKNETDYEMSSVLNLLINLLIKSIKSINKTQQNYLETKNDRVRRS